MPRTRPNLIFGPCSNVECEENLPSDFQAPFKCPGCHIAKYCSRDCQRAHWPSHRHFCDQWPVANQPRRLPSLSDIKRSQLRFLRLIRGLPEYSRSLLDTYVTAKHQQGFRGAVEFQFETFEEMMEAIKLVESLPIKEEAKFYPMTYDRTYQARADGRGPVGQKIPLRLIFPEHKNVFMEKVVRKMKLVPLPTSRNQRENMPKLVGIVGDSENMFLLSCSMRVDETQCTHCYEFIYKNLSGYL